MRDTPPPRRWDPKTILEIAEQLAGGGVRNKQYDSCYHLGCDDLLNLSNPALDQMSDAAAHASITLAMSTESINGERRSGGSAASAFPVPHPRKVTG
jgi:hypothetical protein